MEGFGGLIVVVVVVFLIWVFFSSDDEPKKKKKGASKGSVYEVDILAIMSGEIVGGVEGWRKDAASDSQIKRIREAGINIKKRITKGQASDIYGLTLPIEDECLEQLKFFQVSKKGVSQTHARHILKGYFSDAEHIEKWNNRPADAISKLNAKHFGIKIKKGINQSNIDSILYDFAKNNKEDAEKWSHIEYAVCEMRDPDVREMYESKKPSVLQAYSVMVKLVESGISSDSLDADDASFEMLLEMYPKLRR